MAAGSSCYRVLKTLLTMSHEIPMGTNTRTPHVSLIGSMGIEGQPIKRSRGKVLGHHEHVLVLEGQG
eukprot:1839044-Amphidinium_carterae.1